MRAHGTGQVEPVTGQPTRAGVETQFGIDELTLGDPAQSLGLVIAVCHRSTWCANEKPNVKVQVIGLSAPRG